jgi:hypothetical protein
VHEGLRHCALAPVLCLGITPVRGCRASSVGRSRGTAAWARGRLQLSLVICCTPAVRCSSCCPTAARCRQVCQLAVPALRVYPRGTAVPAHERLAALGYQEKEKVGAGDPMAEAADPQLESTDDFLARVQVTAMPASIAMRPRVLSNCSLPNTFGVTHIAAAEPWPALLPFAACGSTTMQGKQSPWL